MTLAEAAIQVAEAAIQVAEAAKAFGEVGKDREPAETLASSATDFRYGVPLPFRLQKKRGPR